MKTKKTPLLVFLANSVEWLAVALVFAFVFRAFVVEAFKIPTGSMAPTLRGDHFEIACVQCGYEYDVNRSEGYDNQISKVKFKCPSCGYHEHIFSNYTGGDRILVYKGFASFQDPKRWDVFVFKNPTEPHINYIKRAIGLPNEKLELIDGDVFINDKIARKPEKVQKSLWMPVYDGDFIPARPHTGGFSNNNSWNPPFLWSNGWSFEDSGATVILNSNEETILQYDDNVGNGFRATYGYNAPIHDKKMEIVSDFKVDFWAQNLTDKSVVGAVISKYGRNYIAKVDFEKSKILLSTEYNDTETILESINITGEIPEKAVFFSLSNADYKLSLKFGKYNLSAIIGEKYGDIGTYKDGNPAVGLIGKGQFELKHFTLYRDLHYMSRDMMGADQIRGGEGNPITLGEDEFFACGDNSPQSLDSRLWDQQGLGNNGKKYPLGVVPRDFLIGQAFFVYWPGSYQRAPKKGPGMIPNAGMMRWIYGGSDSPESLGDE